MKKGFTIVEVSILFVIFLIVAFLVAPLSIDDTMQARYTSKWRSKQQDFINLSHSINSYDKNNMQFKDIIKLVLENEYSESISVYKTRFLNGNIPSEKYQFKDLYLTYNNAVISLKLFEEPKDNILGIIMYDINGRKEPNTWGKDIYGLNVYETTLEPFGKNKTIQEQKKDCSKNGRGVYCSNYYVIGGNFD